MYHDRGNPVSCAELTASASRVIVALGYHRITNTVPRNDLDAEKYAAVAHCAQLDSIMSLLLLRPRSLPTLEVNVSELLQADPCNPMSIFEIAPMKMVPVHNKVLDLTLESNLKRSMVVLKEEVAQLRTQMKHIHEVMVKVLTVSYCVVNKSADEIRNDLHTFSRPRWTS
jgi:hypothetical protein